MRALAVVKCQLALVHRELRSCCQAAISSTRVCLLAMRRLRHWEIGRRARTPPDRASCRAWGCSAIRSVRPAGGLRRQGRLHKAKPCGGCEIILDQDDGLGVGEVDI